MSNYKTMARLGPNQAGNDSADVRVAQSILSSNGYLTSGVDGKFGLKTAEAVRHWQMTHTDMKGKPLSVDGWIGDKTWWSLLNPGAVIIPPEPVELSSIGLSPDRAKLVDAAFAEYRKDVREIPDGSNWGGRVSLYLAGIGAAPWCAYFIMWLHYIVFGKYPGGVRRGLVLDIWNQAKKNKQAHTLEEGYQPIPGDEMVLLYRNSAGKLTGTGHLALVVAAHWKSNKFQTVEGNSGNRVKFLTSSYSRPALVGFINRFGTAEKDAFTQGLLETADVDDGRTR